MSSANPGKQKLMPKDFTMALGAYSHGIKVPLPGADMIFVTGQVALDPSGAVIAPGDAKAQAEHVFKNIEKVLAEGGLTMDDIVKVQIFLTNIKDFQAVSEVRNRYFATSKPASTLFEVSRLVKNGLAVEIEAIAIALKG